MSFWDKLTDYWKENITQNIKKISAIMGNMVINMLAIIIFVIKEGYVWSEALLIIVLAMQPFFYLYVSIVFKGESELKDHEIMQLTQKLYYERELAEYRTQIAAKDGKVPGVVVSVADWNEVNRKLEELQNNKKRI